MDMMADMMQSMSKSMNMDMALMQECIEACSAASMAATMCADSDIGEGEARCSAMCSNCADVATTTMRMLMRPMGYDEGAMMAMLGACVAMGEACAAECRMDGDHDEHCRICAMACDAMVDACRRMMQSMAA